MLFFYLSSSITRAPDMGCSAGRGWSFHSCQEIWIVYFLLPPLRGLKRSKTMLNGSRNWMRMRKAFWDPFNIVLLLLSPREPHTQFASWMETKVVVATTWLPVGIGLAHTTGVISCIYWHISWTSRQMSITPGHISLTSWTFWIISWTMNILWICPGIMSEGQWNHPKCEYHLLQLLAVKCFLSMFFPDYLIKFGPLYLIVMNVLNL